MRAIDRPVDDHRGSALGEGAFDEAMAVHALADHGEEQVAGDDVARIYLDAGNLKFTICGPAHGARGRGRIPQRQRLPVRKIFRPFKDTDGNAHVFSPATAAADSRATMA